MTTEIPTAAELRGLPVHEIRARLDVLPELVLLRGLPDALVLGLPTEVLEWRREKLLASRKGVNLRQVATAIGASEKHVSRLRKNYLATGVESFDALPAPDDELSDDDIRRPGDGRTSRGGSARWRLCEIVRWMIDRDRTDEKRNGALTLILRPGGRKPPGRTPQPKVPAQRGEQVPAAA
jgi:hypothetical protein